MYTDSNFSRSLINQWILFIPSGEHDYLEKKEVVPRTKKKVEFKSLAHGIIEIVWIKDLIKELKIEIIFIMLRIITSSIDISLILMLHLTIVDIMTRI